MRVHAEETCIDTERSGVVRERDRLGKENEALRAKVALLTQANADLEQFAWAAGHDLKEPLRTIAGYTNLLLRRRPPESGSQEAEFASYIESGIERLHAMIDALLEYARAGRSSHEPCQISDTTSIATEAIEGLQGLMAEREASVSLAPLPPAAAGRTPLLQVFSNLIGNALKYTFEGVPPCIEIFATPATDPSMVQFAVRDNGIGIEPEYLERIFEPFHRLHGEQYAGIGLGLALTKRVVERHGGRIWAESTPACGSTFYFTLPAAEAATAARASGRP